MVEPITCAMSTSPILAMLYVLVRNTLLAFTSMCITWKTQQLTGLRVRIAYKARVSVPLFVAFLAFVYWRLCVYVDHMDDDRDRTLKTEQHETVRV